MTDEQFDQLAEMLEAIHTELQNVVSENQMTSAQLGDIFSELQRAISEIGL